MWLVSANIWAEQTTAAEISSVSLKDHTCAAMFRNKEKATYPSYGTIFSSTKSMSGSSAQSWGLPDATFRRIKIMGWSLAFRYSWNTASPLLVPTTWNASPSVDRALQNRGQTTYTTYQIPSTKYTKRHALTPASPYYKKPPTFLNLPP